MDCTCSAARRLRQIDHLVGRESSQQTDERLQALEKRSRWSRRRGDRCPVSSHGPAYRPARPPTPVCAAVRPEPRLPTTMLGAQPLSHGQPIPAILPGMIRSIGCPWSWVEPWATDTSDHGGAARVALRPRALRGGTTAVAAAFRGTYPRTPAVPPGAREPDARRARSTAVLGDQGPIALTEIDQ